MFKIIYRRGIWLWRVKDDLLDLLGYCHSFSQPIWMLRLISQCLTVSELVIA